MQKSYHASYTKNNPNNSLSSFRVRDTSSRFGANSEAKMGRVEEGLNDSHGLQSTAMGGGEPTQTVTSSYQTRAGNARPFLEQLFEDLRAEEAAEDEDPFGIHNTSNHDSRLPQPTYRDEIRRQSAKPNVLSFCVSTDSVPLPTTTGTINYTAFDYQRFVEVADPQAWTERRRIFAGVHGATEMRRTRDATSLLQPPLSAIGFGESHQQAGMSNDKSATQFYNEDDEVRQSHLKFLLNTIERAKGKVEKNGGPNRQPWIV